MAEKEDYRTWRKRNHPKNIMKSFEILDDIEERQDRGSIEVQIKLKRNSVESGDTDRWCFFMTAKALTSCGDVLEDEGYEDIRIHFGVAHMITVPRINEEIIKRVLVYLDTQGDLLMCTKVCGE